MPKGVPAVVVKGSRFNQLTVMREVDPPEHLRMKIRHVKCRCDCGATVVVSLSGVRCGATKSCGCLKRPHLVKGMSSGRLTVIREVAQRGNTRRVECSCSCGNRHVANLSLVRTGRVLSCGCLQRENALKANTTHGMTAHPLYGVHKDMMRRCYDPDNAYFAGYGGRRPRPIRVCREWRDDKLVFFAWAKRRWKPGLLIERINNECDYAPDNCKFADRFEQANNTRRNIYYKFRGRRLTVYEISRECGIEPGKLRHRLRMGWSMHEATTHGGDARVEKRMVQL